MHPYITVMHWSHHMRNNLLIAWHEIDQHLHSRHFWAGVAVTLLIVGFVAVMVILAMRTPTGTMEGFPYGYPMSPLR